LFWTYWPYNIGTTSLKSCSRSLVQPSHPKYEKLMQIKDPRERRIATVQVASKIEYCGGPPPMNISKKFNISSVVSNLQAKFDSSKGFTGCHCRSPIWIQHKTEVICGERKIKINKRVTSTSKPSSDSNFTKKRTKSSRKNKDKDEDSSDDDQEESIAEDKEDEDENEDEELEELEEEEEWEEEEYEDEDEDYKKKSKKSAKKSKKSKSKLRHNSDSDNDDDNDRIVDDVLNDDKISLDSNSSLNNILDKQQFINYMNIHSIKIN
jgi:hypothetical protein